MSVSEPAGPTTPTVLVVDPDRAVLEAMRRSLADRGYRTLSARSSGEALELLRAEPVALVLAEAAGDGCDGLALLDHVRAHCPETVVVLTADYGSVEAAMQAVRRGAFDYLPKPVVDDDLCMVVARALDHQRVLAENRRLRSAAMPMAFEGIVGGDWRMVRVFELIEAVADSRATVLITGESGTGKSLVARAIHRRSRRREGPFVEVSCGALPEMLLETELFGHVRGAFTDAVGDRQGKFAAADGGTIFLDEISAASAALQVKLLRVLQERTFEPVGSNRTVSVDVRVIVASNRDLWGEVEAGRFRRDLYYRVNVVNIALPPLRERMGDIMLLAEHFLRRFARENGKAVVGFTDRAARALEAYHWPGNVRELENCIERAVVLSRTGRIDLEDLPEELSSLALAGPAWPTSSSGPARGGRSPTLAEALAEPEKQIIRAALRAHGGSRTATARALGINRTTLYKKMKKYGLLEKGRAD